MADLSVAEGDTYWYLLSNDLYQYQYFDGCMCVASPEQVASKLAELNGPNYFSGARDNRGQTSLPKDMGEQPYRAQRAFSVSLRIFAGNMPCTVLDARSSITFAANFEVQHTFQSDSPETKRRGEDPTQRD